jgi:hypothetical protein
MASTATNGAVGADLVALERPTRGETAGLAGRGGFNDHENNTDLNPSADLKALATLRASFALRGGHMVQELEAGGFVVIWRGLPRERRMREI